VSASGDISVEQWAARAWRARALIELQAQQRFARLSAELERFDPDSPVVGLLSIASEEEATHAELCNELAKSLGENAASAPAQTPSVAPASLQPREKLLYEIVAACCVAETESMATLTLLLAKMSPGRYREAVHRIAKDEVDHAQAGWAHLAREAARGRASFLSAHLVAMLNVGPVHELFATQPCVAAGSDELYRFGVVPHAKKREVFVQVMNELIMPGLRHNGVDPTPLQEWLTRLDTSP